MTRKVTRPRTLQSPLGRMTVRLTSKQFQSSVQSEANKQTNKQPDRMHRWGGNARSNQMAGRKNSAASQFICWQMLAIASLECQCLAGALMALMLLQRQEGGASVASVAAFETKMGWKALGSLVALEQAWDLLTQGLATWMLPVE